MGDIAFKVETRPVGQNPFCARRQNPHPGARGPRLNVCRYCQEGNCGTCKVKLLWGRINHRDILLTARRREATDCTMVCVSRAANQRDAIVLDGRSFGFSLVWPNSRHGQRGHIPPVRSLVDSGSDGL
ncbi:2Fe-2S iron-sulfur cluster-binding protein [Rhizobium mongolense]|uniref:2Fe-2S iron-sulfur cluster-binding protein n=1 Tax=Rhizobium mongolense TaxID=57676 RepID=UPI0035E4624C